MIKRILPFYLTGWFYLTLVFWVVMLCYVSSGGFNTANQLNLSWLASITTEPPQKTNSSVLSSADILTLHSSFEESDANTINTLLSSQENSQVVILGKASKAFINKLDSLLSKQKRQNKIIINSQYEFSESPLKVNYSMFLSSALNWFRFNESNNTSIVKSKHFVFSPLLLNERQSFPLLWQHQGETYASLLAEVLQQLHRSNELTLNEQSQLMLNNNEENIGPEQYYLGFYGEIFTIGDAYQLDQYGLKIHDEKPYYLIKNNDNRARLKINATQESVSDSESEYTQLSSVQQFINQHKGYATKPIPSKQYKVIILTEHIFDNNEVLKPLLINLTQENYLSQGLLTLLFTATLALLGFALIWFIQSFTFKQQIACIIGYFLVLLGLQSLMYNQQQWLEVLPILLTVSGSWVMFYAYHKEDSLFSTTLVRQAEKLKSSASPASVIAKHNAKNQKRPGYKAPQNFSPTATIASNPADEFDKTILMDSSSLQKKPKTSHHITVENFGRYQVEGILGKGAMGIVYQGVDPKINRHVAIKTLQLATDANSEESKEAKDRFFREAQTAGGLSHANIVTIYDVGEENNLGYIAMDLLTGAPLSIFTQPGQTLQTPLVYQLLIQITDALEYAHKQKVVHRDIKPANIIFDDDLMKVTVTDFGIAYVSDHSKTRTGVIMGSPYYMSPEQILGLKVDGRSDIFSLGVTFYQLLCGHLPFEGESIATVAYQITKAKPIAVNTHNSELPASALRITNKAMHKDIDKRYQTMAEFKLALVNALKRDYKITAN